MFRESIDCFCMHVFFFAVSDFVFVDSFHSQTEGASHNKTSTFSEKRQFHWVFLNVSSYGSIDFRSNSRASLCFFKPSQASSFGINYLISSLSQFPTNNRLSALVNLTTESRDLFPRSQIIMTNKPRDSSWDHENKTLVWLRLSIKQ